MSDSAEYQAVFRVIDVYDHPHGGRILRLRLARGQAPGVKVLKGGELIATPPAPAQNGNGSRLTVAGFAVSGGKASDERFARTGRIDVHVRGDNARPVDVGWVLAGPA